MRPFEERWLRLCERARGEAPLDLSPPLGFSNRVAARALALTRPSAEDVCVRLALRSLAAVSSLVVLLALMEWRSRSHAAVLSPGIENTVAQIIGSL